MFSLFRDGVEFHSILYICKLICTVLCMYRLSVLVSARQDGQLAVWITLACICISQTPYDE